MNVNDRAAIMNLQLNPGIFVESYNLSTARASSEARDMDGSVKVTTVAIMPIAALKHIHHLHVR
jgi:hypothetical protein